MADDQDTKKSDPLAWVRQKAAEAEARMQKKAEQKAQIVRLPVWPEPVRALPNGLLRSALFGVIRKGRRRYLKAELLEAIDGVEVRYTGERLDQGDLDAYLAILHAVRDQPLGDKCCVTSYALLKLMGLESNGKNRKILHEHITRMVACAVELSQGRYTYIGSLIDEAYKDKKTRKWVIVLNSKLRRLFAPDQYTQIDWEVRRRLNGHPLAQWLHGFYSSHAKPYPVKIETLQKLCGSEAGEVWKFAQTLRQALDAVAKACEAHGEAFRYEIRDGVVYVERKPSKSQMKHLIRKAKPKKPPSSS